MASQVVQDAFKLVNKELKECKNVRMGEDADDDLFVRYDKYTLLEAETQFKNVFEALKNAGFIDEEEAERKKNEEEEESNKNVDEKSEALKKIPRVHFGRVRLLTDEDGFKDSFKRFQGDSSFDKMVGLTDAKAKYAG
jgi:hypothetical protein